MSIFSIKSIIIGEREGQSGGFDSVVEFYLTSTPLEHKENTQ